MKVSTGLAAVSVVVASVEAFGVIQTKRSVMEMKRRGGGSFRNVGSSSGGKVGASSSTPMSSGSSGGNWFPVSGIKSMKSLNLEEGKVQLVDTNVKAIVDGATNPTGAISVVQSGGKTFAASVGCSCCKIPLNKAKVLEPNEETDGADPRLACDFCGATYNIRTGKRVKAAGSGGLLGGVVKGLFSKSDEEPLKVYALGEKNGKVFINLGL